MELVRHMDSGNKDKAERSSACLSVLAGYPDLIVCDSCDIPEELIYSTHADREILSMLISGKGKYRQLLITNDNDLASDAIALNDQLSCPGKMISVKRVNRSGELKSFKKRRPAESTVSVGGTANMPSRKDGVSAEQPAAAPVSDPVYTQKLPASATSASSGRNGSEPSSAGVPLPLFILGMVGTGILGALFGVVASSRTLEDSELAA